MIVSRPVQVPDIGSCSGVKCPGRVLGEQLANRSPCRRPATAATYRRSTDLLSVVFDHLVTPRVVGGVTWSVALGRRDVKYLSSISSALGGMTGRPIAASR